MVGAWFEDRLDILGLNFSTITLVQKESEATSMIFLGLVSLLNCSFKIFSKVLTHRFSTIIGRLIPQCQPTFIKGRFNLESVTSAHEVYRKKNKGLVFKTDYGNIFFRIL
jgi:hypothetical protein